MYHKMSFEAAGMKEGFGTLLTLEGLFPLVDSFTVILKRGLHLESSCALGAIELPI